MNGTWTTRTTLTLLALAGLAFAREAAADDTRFARERAAMVENIRIQARSATDLVGKDGISEKILAVMARTERHLFVPDRHRYLAYDDNPVPIGHGQTISQPLIVAVMTQLAEVKPDHTVLEIGTGSGYQAAVLARLARKVCTIEIVRPLGEVAEKLLMELGYKNVRVKIGDGYEGWADCGPFDAVIVTAALGHVPPPLIDQLKPGGRVVMPVGLPGAAQQLAVVEKTASGETRTRFVGLVRFVPFIRPKN